MVLVVDDQEAGAAKLVEEILEAPPAEFQELAVDGQDALDRMHRAHDVMMPRLDGFEEVCRRLRAPRPAFTSCPIVILTALSDTDKVPAWAGRRRLL